MFIPALNYSGYEKACVLFNIAAYQSKYASTLDLTNDEEMRIAVQYYQKSANIFELLKNDIMHFLQDEVPRDMQPQLLNALAQLMITQANEVMYVKAVKGGSSPSILSSLAMHLAESYENIYKSLSYEQARGIVDKVAFCSVYPLKTFNLVMVRYNSRQTFCLSRARNEASL